VNVNLLLTVSSKKLKELELKGLLVTTLCLLSGPFLVLAPAQANTQSISRPAPQTNKIIASIEVRLIDESGTAYPITAQHALFQSNLLQTLTFQPGDRYDPFLAKSRLAKLEGTAEQLTLTTAATADPQQVALVITAQQPNEFFYGFGRLPEPTALRGPLRPDVTDTVSDRAVGFSIGAYGGLANIGNSDHSLAVGLVGGVNALGVELDYTYQLDDSSGLAVNFANRRGVETEFENGEIDVDTPTGDDPWVHRIGGGAEYFREFSPALSGAVGLSYQRITVRDGAFSDDTFAVDEVGNPLTVSDRGADDLLTINLVGDLDYRDNPANPGSGSRLLFGMDQSIPVGNASTFFNRLSANYTYFLPLNLFGFAEGNRTLVLNAQGGTILGDAPPYEAFSLGGPDSVRGYGRGEVGTGRSFLQASAEYRFPIANFSARRQSVNLGGTLFADFGSDLGSGSAVIGTPAESRDKPGSGFGAGVGLRAVTGFGTGRTALGINDQGDINLLFSVGDRF
jgi:outer membrane protein insertion porin family